MFDHTVGSHSDDRGGDSDYPCHCQDPKPLTQQPSSDWIDTLLGKTPFYKSSQVKQAIQTKLIEAEKRGRLEELYDFRLSQLAVDVFAQPFSKNFQEQWEKRVKQLEADLNKVEEKI